MTVIKGLLAAALMAAALGAQANDGPYNEQANAQADVQQALHAAQANHHNVLLVFGANWCGDCRALDKALHGSS
jgi:thioredoxin 1